VCVCGCPRDCAPQPPAAAPHSWLLLLLLQRMLVCAAPTPWLLTRVCQRTHPWPSAGHTHVCAQTAAGRVAALQAMHTELSAAAAAAFPAEAAAYE
jgi:hypothetical protein